MDNLLEPTPAKRRCITRNESKIQQCIREFRLPQQFPSTLKQAVKLGIVNTEESPSSIMPKNVTVLSGVERQVPCKLPKLRIISPNGKDLGEFNVELRTDNPSKVMQTFTITKSSTLKFCKKPVTVSPISQTRILPRIYPRIYPRILPRILKQGTARIPNYNLMDIKSCDKNNSETNKINVLQQSTTLPINKTLMIGSRDTKTSNKEAQACNVEILIPMSETNSKQSMYETIDSNNQKHIMHNGVSNINSHIKIPNITITTEDNETSATKVSLYKEIIESPFPIVNCKKLALNSSDSNNIHRSEDYFKNAISTQYNSAESSAGEKNVINVPNGKITLWHDTQCENVQNKHVLKKGSENDCSAVAIDNPVQCVPESQQITNTIDSIMQLDVQNEDYPKDSTQADLSDQWNIIKKAMDSVKDNKLRALALKALTECGIGIERHVPIRLPEKHKAVHDTQVQTMVFGLLDPKSFVFINKDLDNIQKVNQITLYDMRTNQDQSLTSGLHSNDSLFKAPLTIEQESDFDIDSFIKQIFDESSDVVKMKETLSVTKIRCKNLLEHLERDFESVKRYDQSGMLNIHNAVVSNNIHLVQRQIMILEQCKESVDIFTEDGATSLELAIKYDAHSEIVKLLLKAGAQPVIPKYIHESALIIASKRSSPMLSMLINQVSDPKLLDQIDSEGLAALHYCSMRDNLQGVKALLSAGATIDLKDMRSGRTSLFHALDNSHKAVAQTLLKAGAVTNVTNYAGQTPLPIVAEKIVF
ncbi:unnamed protein product [Lasius platythorax]|uniref:Uncharacterized protein n=1 Tax=Lasius platythorax TaxID=488582 RepID=A0AAV2NHM6_9HYME